MDSQPEKAKRKKKNKKRKSIFSATCTETGQEATEKKLSGANSTNGRLPFLRCCLFPAGALFQRHLDKWPPESSPPGSSRVEARSLISQLGS